MIEKPKLQLVGLDGNAFSILGRAFSAARKAGWPQQKINEYKTKATSGDYDNLLRVTMEHFDVDSDDEDDEYNEDDEDDEDDR